MGISSHPHRSDDVYDFYQSSVVIDTFNAGFAGRWHTRIIPDADGPKCSEDYLAELLGLQAQHRLLDFGCGVGVVAVSLAQRLGCTVRGLNIASKQLEQARWIREEAGMRQQVEFDLYDGGRFPYPDASFDRIIFLESVCHVPDRQRLAEELFRVLRPGGLLAGQDWMLTDAALPQQEYDDWILPIEASCEVALDSLLGYRDLLERAGFRNLHTLDARTIYQDMPASFTRPDGQPKHVEAGDDMATRLAKGNVALSNAFHRGLFTIGFVRGEKPRRTVSCGRVRPDGSDFESGSIDCFSSAKNLAVMRRHLSLFAVPPAPELEAFVALVAASPMSTAEASVRVEGGAPHAARFNLFFHHQFEAGYRRARGYLKGLSLDLDLLDELMGERFDFSRLDKVVVGIDLRDDPAESRAKLWFMLRDYPEIVERALSIQDDDGRVRSLMLHAPFLVGFDFHLDGKSHIKLYPDLRPEELASRQVTEEFDHNAIAAMAQCFWTHVYFRRAPAPRKLQFHPREPDVFIERYLDADLARPIHSHYQGHALLDMVVAMREDALSRGPARDFALYYMPRGEVPAGQGNREAQPMHTMTGASPWAR